MEFIQDLILNGGLVIIIACLGVGELIKRWIPNEVLHNRFIPLINTILGAALVVMIPTIFPEQSVAVMALYGGILGAAASGIFDGVTSLFFK